MAIQPFKVYQSTMEDPVKEKYHFLKVILVSFLRSWIDLTSYAFLSNFDVVPYDFKLD